jgi:hypothetical protein
VRKATQKKAGDTPRWCQSSASRTPIRKHGCTSNTQFHFVSFQTMVPSPNSSERGTTGCARDREAVRGSEPGFERGWCIALPRPPVAIGPARPGRREPVTAGLPTSRSRADGRHDAKGAADVPSGPAADVRIRKPRSHAPRPQRRHQRHEQPASHGPWSGGGAGDPRGSYDDSLAAFETAGEAAQQRARRSVP